MAGTSQSEVTDVDNFLTMAEHIRVHDGAGHTPDSNSKMLTDVRTAGEHISAILDRIDIENPARELSERALLVRIGRELVRQGQKKDAAIMGRLDTITQALTDAGSAATAEAAQVKAHLERLEAKAVTLQETIDGLRANTVTDEDLAGASEQAAGLVTSIKGIDTEGDDEGEDELTVTGTVTNEDGSVTTTFSDGSTSTADANGVVISTTDPTA